MDFEKAMKTDGEVVDPGKPEDFVSDPGANIHGSVIKVDPMDPAPLLALFDKYITKIDGMSHSAAVHKVSDDKSNDRAVEMTAQAKKLSQLLERMRKDKKDPYLRVIKNLDGCVKKLNDKLAKIQNVLSLKITPWLLKKKRDQDEKDALAQKEADKLQAKLDAEAKEKADALRKKLEAENKPEEAAAVQIEVPPLVVAQIESELKISTPSGTSKLKEKWEGTLKNFKELPESCIQDRWEEIEKAVQPWIRRQIAAGIRTIPGVDVQNVVRVDIRVKKN